MPSAKSIKPDPTFPNTASPSWASPLPAFLVPSAKSFKPDPIDPNNPTSSSSSSSLSNYKIKVSSSPTSPLATSYVPLTSPLPAFLVPVAKSPKPDPIFPNTPSPS